MGVEVDQAGKHSEARPVDDLRAIGRLSASADRLDALGLDGDALAGADIVRDAVDQSSGLDIERFGHRPLPRRAHQRVVANGVRGAHRFFHVALFHDWLARAVSGARRPDAGVAIGLKLHADLQRIAFGLRGALLRAADLIRNAADRLDMMADLVRDHIGLCRVACGAEFLFEFAEEAGVEIDALVGGTIEGAHRRACGAATRIARRLFIEIERRLAIAGDQTLPHRMRRSEHIAREAFARGVAGDIGAATAVHGRIGGAAAAAEHIGAGAEQEKGGRADQQDRAATHLAPEQHRKKSDKKPTETAAPTAAKSTAATAAQVADVVTGIIIVEAHGASPPVNGRFGASVTAAPGNWKGLRI